MPSFLEGGGDCRVKRGCRILPVKKHLSIQKLEKQPNLHSKWQVKPEVLGKEGQESEETGKQRKSALNYPGCCLIACDTTATLNKLRIYEPQTKENPCMLRVPGSWKHSFQLPISLINSRVLLWKLDGILSTSRITEITHSTEN